MEGQQEEGSALDWDCARPVGGTAGVAEDATASLPLPCGAVGGDASTGGDGAATLSRKAQKRLKQQAVNAAKKKYQRQQRKLRYAP